jgi:hypothetical protein
MASIHANFETVALSGTQSHYTGRETGVISSTTIHQIYCLSAGSIIITPLKGPSFTWAATINTSIDVLVKATTVSSGTFIGFKSKLDPMPGRVIPRATGD